MRMIRWLSKKIRSMARQRGDRPASQFRNLKDPELAAIAAIAQHRRLDAERSLEAAFEKARPILRRVSEPVRPIQIMNLPADIEARVRAMPDPEQRIRAIVEFKLSSRTESNHQAKPSR